MPNGKAIKKRNWTFLVYPTEGNPPAPADWLEILKLSGLQCAISPLHDADLNADETEKRPHHHVIAVYGSPTTFSNVKRLTDSLNAPIPKPLEQVRGMYRYFTHKDNPEKAQYDEKDIISIGGFDVSEFVELTKHEVKSIIKRVHAFIRERNINEYADLMDILADEDMSTEYEIASNHTLFFQSYIRSRFHRGRPTQYVTDPATGEVVR